ncbi:hypothetical protein [Streptococcus phage phi-m46.1]|nr:hypothetical protein [Streptococcus phage phi-m46.1]
MQTRFSLTNKRKHGMETESYSFSRTAAQQRFTCQNAGETWSPTTKENNPDQSVGKTIEFAQITKGK